MAHVGQPVSPAVNAGSAILLLVSVSALTAEIVDRIAVTVGNQVITETQVIEEIRVTAFLNRDQPAFGPEQKRKAAERLVEQTLIRRDMEFVHLPETGQSEAEKLAEQLRSAYTSTEAFQAELAKYSITEDELRGHLLWQVTLLKFIDYRFRPSVQVPETEIREYYESKLAEWAAQAQSPPTLDEARNDIERILIQKRVDQAMDRWLGDVRTQVAINYRKEALQ